MVDACICGVGSAGHCAPPINSSPRRLQRTRKRANYCPSGSVYVGRPTLWANPFSGRYAIGHARSVILYGQWLAGNVSDYVLRCAHFSRAEAEALNRWRERVVTNLPSLRGFDLQCWCPLTSAWCHADVLLRRTNQCFSQ